MTSDAGLAAGAKRMSDMEDPFRLVEAPAAGCRSEMRSRCEICALPSSHLTRCIPARTSIVESPRSSVHRPGARRGSLQRGSRTSASAAIAVIRGLPLILAATKRGTARQALQLCPILERHKTYYLRSEGPRGNSRFGDEHHEKSS